MLLSVAVFYWLLLTTAVHRCLLLTFTVYLCPLPSFAVYVWFLLPTGAHSCLSLSVAGSSHLQGSHRFLSLSVAGRCCLLMAVPAYCCLIVAADVCWRLPLPPAVTVAVSLLEFLRARHVHPAKCFSLLPTEIFEEESSRSVSY